MKRVMIVGGPGSGKSTLARLLGDKTGLPVVHVDRMHWMAGWQERPRAEKIAMARAVEETDAWIFEGSLSATWPTRAARSDTLIWLDLPVGLRLWRVTKRLVLHLGRSRPDMAEGCREWPRLETVRFYKWIWDTRHSRGEGIRDLLKAHPHLRVHHLQGRRAVQRFLESFE